MDNSTIWVDTGIYEENLVNALFLLSENFLYLNSRRKVERKIDGELYFGFYKEVDGRDLLKKFALYIRKYLEVRGKTSRSEMISLEGDYSIDPDTGIQMLRPDCGTWWLGRKISSNVRVGDLLLTADFLEGNIERTDENLKVFGAPANPIEQEKNKFLLYGANTLWEDYIFKFKEIKANHEKAVLDLVKKRDSSLREIARDFQKKLSKMDK